MSTMSRFLFQSTKLGSINLLLMKIRVIRFKYMISMVKKIFHTLIKEAFKAN